MSGVDTVDAAFTLFDKDWGEAVGAATEREGGVFVGVSEVGWDEGVEAEY